jgi:hypothetical protein
MHEKQEIRKWNIQQTAHHELDDTPGQQFVTTFQGQLNIVPTVSEATVTGNYFTLRSYSYSYLVKPIVFGNRSCPAKFVCLGRRYGSNRANHDCKCSSAAKTIRAGVQTFSKNPEATPKIYGPQGWHKTSSVLRTQTLRDTVQNSVAVATLLPGFVRPCCRE